MSHTNSTTALDIFNYHQQDIRVIMLDGEPWWIAADVCKVLEHSDVSMAVRRLDDDEKLIQAMFVSGQNRNILCINEPGLYSLILTSRKPEAKAFKRWITHEVLPSIRKTGAYSVATPAAAAQTNDPYLLVLPFDKRPMRISIEKDSAWFVANDICQALHLSKAAARLVDVQEKGQYAVETSGGKQSMLHLNQAGVHVLVLSAEKKQAKAFVRWFLYEAMPTIDARTQTRLALPSPYHTPPLKTEEIDWRILRTVVQCEQHYQFPSATDIYQRLYRRISRDEITNRLQILILRGDISPIETARTVRYCVRRASRIS